MEGGGGCDYLGVTCLLPLFLSVLSLSMVALPVYVTPQFTFAEGTGKFNVKVGLKQTMGKVVR